MLELTNIGPAVDVYGPPDHPDSLHVESGQVISVPGDLAAEQPDDAYLVGEGDDARLWPHSQWRLSRQQDTPTSAFATSDTIHGNGGDIPPGLVAAANDTSTPESVQAPESEPQSDAGTAGQSEETI